MYMIYTEYLINVYDYTFNISYKFIFVNLIYYI